MTKDRLAVAFALLVQFGAIIWWASQLNAGVHSLEVNRIEFNSRMNKLEDKVEAVSDKVTRLTIFMENK